VLVDHVMVDHRGSAELAPSPR